MGRFADVLSRSRRKDSPVLRSTKARESAGRASRGRTGVDPELDMERGAERSRAEQGKPGQGAMSLRSHHPLPRYRAYTRDARYARRYSPPRPRVLFLFLFLNAALARFLWKSRKLESLPREAFLREREREREREFPIASFNLSTPRRQSRI